jgi:hypothetical protein
MERCSGGEVDAALGLCSALVDHGDAFQLAEAPQEVEHEHRLADACKNTSAGSKKFPGKQDECRVPGLPMTEKKNSGAAKIISASST